MIRAVFTFLIWAGTAAASPLPDAVSDDDFRPINLEEARLGRLLFYDPILSGNRTVACATCHHPAFGTGDGLALGIGDGGIGLGPGRSADPENLPEQRIPRNAPGLFNLGAHEFRVLFHDGRIAVDPNKPGGLRTPLGSDMAEGFASLLSAQTMFPVLSPDEMAGHNSENDVSKAVRQGLITGDGGAWDILSSRIAEIPAYADQFIAVYDHIAEPDEIAFTDISDAIAAFMELEWRADRSPFDSVLRGEAVLAEPAATGMGLFYGVAGCATCHSGPFQTDHSFHAMAAPQIGPGKAAKFESHTRDDGRMRVTGNEADRAAFRTPSLRNVALTAPYGHAGAHADLANFIAHHADPATGYEHATVSLPAMDVDDFAALADPLPRTDYRIDLTRTDINALVAFLNELTDPRAKTGVLGIPESVPSGLDVPNF
ncbi:cytochrome c peroxidase [Cognatiyoonia koreensis]|uniref:Cytochrome c peroxidase n=1 Tax=Cognatiyoonia koreensis TaxID=364200 RepID=A0A1I0PVQ9_9RHOB|nr:cytochrome c peroxidase [Cognatiyoonia koreensis]SEW18451.1 cytochrome c peroxidase [Cognatiyoonia koreensis]